VFNGFSPETIDFMWNLRLNNEKSWFEAHKEEFIRVFSEPMKAMGREVFAQIMDTYPKHGFIHKVSRIYRDARRVRDGRPYHENMWFSIEKPGEEWTSVPVFWFDLSIEGWSYGMGYYAARSSTMAKLRARIDCAPDKFERFIAPLDTQDEFILAGDEYARKKEAPTPKTGAWYNLKSFSLIHRQENGDELYSGELIHRIVRGYKFLMPFYDYFITLDSDPMPC